YRVSWRFLYAYFFFSSRRRHTRFKCDWSSDVCSSDLESDVGEQLPIAYVMSRGGMPPVRVGKPGIDEQIRTGGRTAPGARIEREIGRASCRERGEMAGTAGRGRETASEGGKRAERRDR